MANTVSGKVGTKTVAPNYATGFVLSPSDYDAARQVDIDYGPQGVGAVQGRIGALASIPSIPLRPGEVQGKIGAPATIPSGPMRPGEVAGRIGAPDWGTSAAGMPDGQQASGAPADLSARIQQARQAGYSDDDIYNFLGKNKSYSAKIVTARKSGYSDNEIASHLGLNLAVSDSELDALRNVESGGNPNAVSPAGAKGAYQFMDGTAKQYGIDPNDPTQARDGARRYLTDLKHKYGDDQLAYLAYNWGPGNVDAWLKTGAGANGQPMPAEAQQYVGKIRAAQAKLGNQFSNGFVPSPETQALINQARQGISAPLPDPRAIPANQKINTDPTEGNSFLDNALIGIGKKYTDIGLGARQLWAQATGDTAGSADLRNEAIEKRRMDQAVMNTAGGKTGSIVGGISAALPTILVPGAATWGGAALTGGALGALEPAESNRERLANVGASAAGGLIGKGLGDLAGAAIGKYVSKKVAEKAALQSQNAVKDATLAASKEAGYVVPPTQANPTIANRLLEGYSGKIQTAQAAAIKNQAVTNQLAKNALGIPEDVPLTKDVLGAIRQDAGKAYESLKGVGSIKADNKLVSDLGQITKEYTAVTSEFPELANGGVDNLLSSLGKQDFTSNGLVSLIKRLRFSGSKNIGSVDPAATELGRIQVGAANALEDLIDRNLEQSGQQNLLQAFRDARQTIAKTYSVEGALNESSGNVVASKLAKQLAKDKPLSGELKTIAQFAQAYPKAAQEITSSMPGVSPLDFATGILAHSASGNALGMAGIAARPGVRAAILSKPFQNAAVNAPSYEVNKLLQMLPRAASNKLISAGVRGAGASTALDVRRAQ